MAEQDTTHGALLPSRCHDHCWCSDFGISCIHDCRGWASHVLFSCNLTPPDVLPGQVHTVLTLISCQSVHDLVIHDFRPAVTDACIPAHPCSEAMSIRCISKFHHWSKVLVHVDPDGSPRSSKIWVCFACLVSLKLGEGLGWLAMHTY